MEHMYSSAYCKKCKEHEVCGKYHVYVIELDYTLTKNRKFMSRNHQHLYDMDCLYVGSTSHTCYCRFKQHQLHTKKEEDGFICSCKGKGIFRKFVRSGGHTRGSYYPGVYGMMLRPDLFYRYNPISNQKKALQIEEQLAAFLKKKGYAVWQH